MSNTAELPAGQYCCALCRGIFARARTDEAIEKEFRSTYGHPSGGREMEGDELVLLCDPCYGEFARRKARAAQA